MHPIICTFGPFNLYSYGLMLALAVTISSLLACRRARVSAIDPDAVINLSFVMVVSGIIGARLFYVAANLQDYLQRPLEIVMVQHGGLAWFGGLIVGSLSAFAYLKIKKLPIYPMLDLLAPFVALGQSIGRIGCLLNGCCYGKASEFGIYFSVHDAVLIPTQVYSSLLLLLIFVVLRFAQEKPHREGKIFFLYLLLYSIKRFFIEFLRNDNPMVILGLTLFQVLSAVIFFIAFLNLFLILRHDR
jgi:phosphatidylglycerol---prolipoprotein diacylglyceryl transferase